VALVVDYRGHGEYGNARFPRDVIDARSPGGFSAAEWFMEYAPYRRSSASPKIIVPPHGPADSPRPAASH
jgi:hypothetical protein